MAKRTRQKIEPKPGSYFTGDKPGLQFVSSGCLLLDCALGGGWVLGRIANIVGDRSTAKTALATEAMINFLRQYPTGSAAYRESEAAFDRNYAAAMGLPIDKIEFSDGLEPLGTVEDFYRDISKFIDKQMAADAPGIYVLDSLDALSDEAEMKRDISEGTYALNKAKALSTLFRMIVRKIERSKVLLIVVSQVRDNIGVMFGEKHKRSGGKALDFYCSHIAFLAHVKTLKKTMAKVERPYGITVKVRIKKNKVGLPFREAEFDFIFGYGIEDVGASVEWLAEVGRLKDIDLTPTDAKGYLKELEGLTAEMYDREKFTIDAAVKKAWQEIEVSFLPIRKKYG